MIYLLLGCAVLVILWLLLRGFVNTPPQQIISLGKYILVAAVGIAGVFMLATGRAASLIYLAGALVPLLIRSNALATMWRNMTGPSPGQVSEVATAWLRVNLDHDSGRMTGTVLDGPYRGRQLAELSQAQLIDMLIEARIHDPDSGPLLEAYLDREHADWRTSAGDAGAAGAGGTAGSAAAAPSSGAMTRDEALRVLGLPATATPQDVRDAYRRLMLKLHPDHGGSDYFAAKLNEAKRVLVGE